MIKRLPSSLILIVYGVIQLFFNQVIIGPFLYKLNYKLSFLILIFIYFIQALMFIIFKNKYENIRAMNLDYYKVSKRKTFNVFFILYSLISIIIILFLIFFFFTFLNAYFFINSKYTFIIPLLFVVTSFALTKSFYAIFQYGIMVFIIIALQFIIFFSVPKEMEITFFLPLDYSFNPTNIKIFLVLPSIILIPLLSLPSATLASTPFTYRESLIIGTIFFIFNSYFLFIQVKQLGVIISYLEHPFYSIYDALDLGFYTEHLYIVPFTICIITTFLFLLILLHSMKLLSHKDSTNKLNILFALIIGGSILGFNNVELFNRINNDLFLVLSILFILLLLFSLLIFNIRRKKANEKN